MALDHEALNKMIRLSAFTSDEAEAYRAGYDAAMNGANAVNTHSRHFREKRLTAAWERGMDAGNAEHKRLEELASKKRRKSRHPKNSSQEKT